VTRDNKPRQLTAQEFELMMGELDTAQDWMLDQMKQRRTDQEHPHVPTETDQ
jgi:hypothetical protein